MPRTRMWQLRLGANPPNGRGGFGNLYQAWYLITFDLGCFIDSFANSRHSKHILALLRFRLPFQLSISSGSTAATV